MNVFGNLYFHTFLTFKTELSDKWSIQRKPDSRPDEIKDKDGDVMFYVLKKVSCSITPLHAHYLHLWHVNFKFVKMLLQMKSF